MCTVLLPPSDNPIVVNKYIISYHIIKHNVFIFVKGIRTNTYLNLCVLFFSTTSNFTKYLHKFWKFYVRQDRHTDEAIKQALRTFVGMPDR